MWSLVGRTLPKPRPTEEPSFGTGLVIGFYCGYFPSAFAGKYACAGQSKLIIKFNEVQHQLDMRRSAPLTSVAQMLSGLFGNADLTPSDLVAALVLCTAAQVGTLLCLIPVMAYGRTMMYAFLHDWFASYCCLMTHETPILPVGIIPKDGKADHLLIGWLEIPGLVHLSLPDSRPFWGA